jgi:hypothetical protein
MPHLLHLAKEGYNITLPIAVGQAEVKSNIVGPLHKMSRFAATIPGYGRGVGYRRMEVKSAVKKPRSDFCHLTGGRELNKFDVGEGDFAILGLKMSKKNGKILRPASAELPFIVIFSGLPRNEHRVQ